MARLAYNSIALLGAFLVVLSIAFEDVVTFGFGILLLLGAAIIQNQLTRERKQREKEANRRNSQE